jgi:hypothetical protein
MQETYRLVVRRGPQPNQAYDLTKDISTLGRDITNDIVINDREVSRHHMRITRGVDGHTVEDLGSTNGTFINGKRLSGVTSLQNGDIIGLGETVTLAFELARTQSTLPSSPPPVASAPASQSESAQDYSPYQPPQPQAQQSYQPQPQNQYQPTPSYQHEEPPSYSPSPPPAPSYSVPQAPPVAGYEYDPYAIREDEGSGVLRWFLFGCLGLLLVCCCVTVLGLVVIDQMNLWCDVPIITNIVEALGLQTC